MSDLPKLEEEDQRTSETLTSSSTAQSVAESISQAQALVNDALSENHQTIDPQTCRREAIRRKLKILSVDKLDFSRIASLYGRDEENNKLQDLFDRTCCHANVNKGRDKDKEQQELLKGVPTTHGISGGLPSPPRCCFCTVQGLSGTGKSALVHKALQTLVKTRGGLYAVGKFDLQHLGEPLSAIRVAVHSLVDQIINLQDTEKLKTIQAKLVAKDVESDLPLLIRLIPNLASLLLVEKEQQPGEICSSTDTEALHGAQIRASGFEDGFKEAMDHFNFALRKFLQIVTSVSPVVMVYDDLQWSDLASLNLIHTWITDEATKSFMIVGCFRNDDTCTDGLSKTIEEIESYSVERSIAVQNILLENLTSDPINELLVDVLCVRDPLKAKELSQIVLKKSGGNPFSIQQYLVSLSKQGLLNYNFGLEQWEWKEEDIRARSLATEQIGDLMTKRLADLSVASKILPLAACLGSTFKLETLTCVLCGEKEARALTSTRDHFSDGIFGTIAALRTTQAAAAGGGHADFEELLVDVLYECQEEGLVEDMGNGRYSFIHDKVQESALALIGSKYHLDLVKFRVGEILWATSSEEEVDDLLFVIVGLLSARLDDAIPNLSNDEIKLDLAQLYYAAGKKAMGLSAFRAAASYFQVAIHTLPQHIAWARDSKFLIDLYSSATESAYCSGDFVATKEHAARILRQPACSPEDKLRVHYVLLDAYTAAEEQDRAIQLGIEMLAQLGCHIPRRMGRIICKTIVGLVWTKFSASKRLTPELIEALPVTTDPIHVGIMRMLDAMMYPCYAGQPELIALVSMEMYHHTLKNGITPYAPVALSFLGFILTHFLGDVPGGKKYAEYAFALLGKYNFASVEPKTLFMIYSGVWHWTHPIQSIMPAFIDIYHKGMRVGDCETALMSIYYYLEAAMYTGRNLATIETDLCLYMHQMVDYNQSRNLHFAQFLLQTIRNFRGKSATTTTLTGSVMNQEECMAKFVQAKDELNIAYIHRRQMYLACFFGEYEMGAELAIKQGDRTLQASVAQISVPVVAFTGALCCFVQAQRTRAAKFRRRAIKYRRLVKRWSQHNPNCVHYLVILNAEKAATLGDVEQAITLYANAITLAGRMGTIQDQALAHQRVGELLLCKQPKKAATADAARDQLGRAMELYSEWNAKALVKVLETKVKALAC